MCRKVHGCLKQAFLIEIYQVFAKKHKVGYFSNRVVNEIYIHFLEFLTKSELQLLLLVNLYLLAVKPVGFSNTFLTLHCCSSLLLQCYLFTGRVDSLGNPNSFPSCPTTHVMTCTLYERSVYLNEYG